MNETENNANNDSNQIKFIKKADKNNVFSARESKKIDKSKPRHTEQILIKADNFTSNERTNFSNHTEVYTHNKQKETIITNTNINKNIDSELNKKDENSNNAINKLKNPMFNPAIENINKSSLKNSDSYHENFKEEYISKFKLKRSLTLKLTTCDILINFFFCKLIKKKNIENKIFDQGNKKLNYYLDVLTVIKKLQELELIKRIIFSADQQSLINFLSKPIISVFDINYNNYSSNKIDFFSFEKMLMIEKNINSEDLANISNSYNNLLSNLSKDEMNINLIKIFETKIKYLF